MVLSPKFFAKILYGYQQYFANNVKSYNCTNHNQ